jgi:hypothetical protein
MVKRRVEPGDNEQIGEPGDEHAPDRAGNVFPLVAQQPIAPKKYLSTPLLSSMHAVPLKTVFPMMQFAAGARGQG